MSTSRYKSKVELLLRIVPIITGESVFAIHGGTAINLFVKNFLRYSVDIDLTYLPLKGRQESINEINDALRRISDKIKKALKGTQVSHREDICKLLCTQQVISSTLNRPTAGNGDAIRGNDKGAIQLQRLRGN
ncbi:MAG: nucleotidyl transferase AbiEii/AbiGii toxin family protein [Bacteroidota bacterium]|jgi:predicted nucleotidyltransferase component of viral defense system|nr:nucleotidyl transferase AbiEii/AbiGii toxin family protein [Bacteroidota bacterium]